MGGCRIIGGGSIMLIIFRSVTHYLGRQISSWIHANGLISQQCWTSSQFVVFPDIICSISVYIHTCSLFLNSWTTKFISKIWMCKIQRRQLPSWSSFQLTILNDNYILRIAYVYSILLVLNKSCRLWVVMRGKNCSQTNWLTVSFFVCTLKKTQQVLTVLLIFVRLLYDWWMTWGECRHRDCFSLSFITWICHAGHARGHLIHERLLMHCFTNFFVNCICLESGYFELLHSGFVWVIPVLLNISSQVCSV